MTTYKAKIDYSKEVNEALNKHQRTNNWANISLSEIESTLDIFLSLEKQTRLGNDLESSQKLAKAILQIFIERKDWERVGELTELLCKRHAQLKKVVSDVIRLSMQYLELTPNDSTKLKLLKILRDLSKGKMHVELEYARMTKDFARMKEESGDIKAAAELIEEIHVETLSSIDFEEKFEFLLEQFRLALLVGATIRAGLTADKFNLKFLDKKKCPNALKLKEQFWTLKIEHSLSNNDYLSASESLLSLQKLQKEDFNRSSFNAMRRAVLYAVIAEDSEKTILFREKTLSDFRKVLAHSEILAFKKLLTLRVEDRLIKWPLEGILLEGLSIGAELPVEREEERLFKELKRTNLNKGSAMDIGPDDVEMKKAHESGLGDKYLKLLKESVSKHNIKVLSKHYTKISLDKIATYTSLQSDEAENVLCEMVRMKKINARIDRPRREVFFRTALGCDAQLDVWAASIEATLSKVQRVCRLVEKDVLLYSKR